MYKEVKHVQNPEFNNLNIKYAVADPEGVQEICLNPLSPPPIFNILCHLCQNTLKA